MPGREGGEDWKGSRSIVREEGDSSRRRRGRGKGERDREGENSRELLPPMSRRLDSPRAGSHPLGVLSHPIGRMLQFARWGPRKARLKGAYTL